MLQRKLSAGSFGVVFKGIDQKTKELAAIKLEKQDNEEGKSIDREVQILQKLSGLPCIPEIKWYGREHNFNVIIQELLGQDLASYLKTQKKFQMHTILLLMDQLLTGLELIHKQGVVHRDLKPENIMTGRDDKQHKVYYIDFGISKIFRDHKGRHIPQHYGKPFIGTTRYASIAAHQGKEIGRKDDLESLGYIIVYFAKGVLPWQNLQNVSDDQRTEKVGKVKLETKFNDLCKDMPPEFPKYFEYLKKLKYKESPDYSILKGMFTNLGKKMNINYLEYDFEWCKDKKYGSFTNFSNKSYNSNGTQMQKHRSSMITYNSSQTNNINVQKQEINNYLNPNLNQKINNSPLISRGSVSDVFANNSCYGNGQYQGSYLELVDKVKNQEHMSSEEDDDGIYDENLYMSQEREPNSDHLSSIEDSDNSQTRFRSYMDEWDQSNHLETKVKKIHRKQVTTQFIQDIIVKKGQKYK